MTIVQYIPRGATVTVLQIFQIPAFTLLLVVVSPGLRFVMPSCPRGEGRGWGANSRVEGVTEKGGSTDGRPTVKSRRE